MKKNVKFTILIVFLLNFISCSKIIDEIVKEINKDEIPTEANHFYFYINNNGDKELNIAKDYSGMEGFRLGLAYANNVGANGQVSRLAAYNHNNFRLTLLFYQNITHTGLYQIMHTDLLNVGSIVSETNLNHSQAYMSYYHNGNVYISEDNSGYVEITYLSTDLQEFKGKFDLTLYNPHNVNDSLVIENGHFWIDLNTLNQ